MSLAIASADDLPEDVPASLTSKGATQREAFNYPNGCHMAEVEIDPETGVIDLQRYVIVDDFGKVVNPLIAEGQAIGGTVQGIGQALLEATVFDKESGQLLSGSYMDYALPRADDVPNIEVHLNQDQPTKTNPLGVKGAGEAGCSGAPPALVNAVCDALADLGVEHVDMPLTPEKIWRTIAEARNSA